MAKRKLGKVGFNYKGVYGNSVEYEKWDVVSFGRGTYLNIVSEGEIIINQSPEDFPNKWKCIAYIGKDGVVDEDLKSELIEVEDVLAFVLNIQHKKNIETEGMLHATDLKINENKIELIDRENIIKQGVISNEEVIAFALNEINNNWDKKLGESEEEAISFALNELNNRINNLENK